MTSTTTAVAAPAIRTADVPVGDGMTMHVNQTGTPGQPALLMLHGSGPGVSGHSNWAALMQGLGDRYHCIAPDIIGFGDSTHPDPSPQGFATNMELRIDKLIRMMDELELDTVTLVGNSMGGMFSLELAGLIPDRIERMVLMGSGGMPDLQPLPGLIQLVTYYDNPSAQSMEELLLLFVHDKEAFGPRIREISAQRAEVAAREDIRRSHLGTFAPGPFRTWSPDELAAIPHKTLVVHGRNDAIVPIESSYYLAEHLPNADLYVLNHCGHWTQVEQATRFRTILSDFVEGLI
ncbi:alpha/beta fold hydrolase [Salinibacterium sp. ZJ450]|uniref:alpha/beta fold hydrolase n=1 Tax=Salinibacterium sp. ZJ450 TaxID=2708338 RepID=UPI001CD5A907|nr:alpha/beta hydrolase [Salinibacterium sp. ZJ450]